MSGIMSMLLGAVSSAVSAVDEFFNRVTLLLPGNGTNGAQNNTFLDSSTNNFTITRNGNTTQGTFSPFSQTGWSNYFDGQDYTNIFVASSADFNLGSGDFTIECFFNSSNAMSTAAFWRLFDTGQIACFFYNGSIYLRNGAGSDLVTVVAHGLSVGVWYHLAFVRSSTTYSIYRNGSLLTSGTGGTITSASAPFVIGTNTSYNQALQGYVSEFRVTTGQALYTTTFTPTTIPLTTTSQGATASNVKLLTCQSNRFVDNSTQNTKTILFGNNGANLGTRFVQAFSPFAPTAAYSAATVGGSGYFDGDDYLTVAGGSSLAFGSGDFSLEAFVYPTASGSAMKIYDARPNTTAGNYPVFERNASNVAVFYVDATALITGTTVIPANTWTHVLVSRVSGNLRLFVNGVQNGSTVSNSTNFANGTARPAIAVRGSSLANDFLTGYISSVRVLIGSGFTSVTVPTAPLTAITNTSLLLNYTNAGITDATAKNDLETVGSAQISTTQSKYGGSSMFFDGVDDYLVMPYSPSFNLGTGQFTIECWINFSTLSGNRIIFDTYTAASAGGGYQLYWRGTGTSIVFYANGVIVAQSSFTTHSTGVWYHIAVTRDSLGDVRIFVDGSQYANSSYTSAIDIATTSRPAVGIQFSTLTNDFHGYINDLRVTKGVARYTSNFTAPTSAFPLQ